MNNNWLYYTLQGGDRYHSALKLQLASKHISKGEKKTTSSKNSFINHLIFTGTSALLNVLFSWGTLWATGRRQQWPKRQLSYRQLQNQPRVLCSVPQGLNNDSRGSLCPHHLTKLQSEMPRSSPGLCFCRAGLLKNWRWIRWHNKPC